MKGKKRKGKRNCLRIVADAGSGIPFCRRFRRKARGGGYVRPYRKAGQVRICMVFTNAPKTLWRFKPKNQCLFAAMRRAGFSRGSLVVYPFTVNLLILAAVTVLYLIVGVPVIAALQVIGATCYFVLSGWAVVLAPVALCALALFSWLFTARKFDREICSC